MKKNPIDELFASKLKEHRLEPSERALERFNQRLDQKNSQRRISPWYFGAAAGLVLASFGLYLMNQDEPKNTLAEKTPVIQNNAIAQVQALSDSNVALKTNRISKTTVKIESLIEVPVENVVIEKSSIIENEIKNIAQSIEPVKEQILIEDSREIFANGNLKPSTLPQLIAPNKEEDVVLTYEVEKMPQERLRRFDDEPIGLAQAIQFEEYYFLHKNESELNEEPSILTKIGNQFKHLKKGEKINFRELGLRPRDIIAKADKFLQEELGLENINKNKNNNSLGN
jgi:hypothetical protein